MPYATWVELMTDDNGEFIYREFFSSYLDDLFCRLVEEGSIEIGNKTADELYAEFRNYIAGNLPFYEEGEELSVAFDFRYQLLERANHEEDSGHYALALTFYAIWLEHRVNGMLTVALGRKGYLDEVIKPLIKELRLKTKMSSLWAIAGLSPFDREALILADRISEHGNAFAHYKWTGYTETARGRLTAEERDLANAARGLAETISDIESHGFWNGRQPDIVTEIRTRIAEDLQGLSDEVVENFLKKQH